MIRLAKLPERNPIKLGIVLTPTLHAALIDYAAFYAEHYGIEEPLGELIPAILGNFIENDRAFQRRLREHTGSALPCGVRERVDGPVASQSEK